MGSKNSQRPFSCCLLACNHEPINLILCHKVREKSSKKYLVTFPNGFIYIFQTAGKSSPKAESKSKAKRGELFGYYFRSLTILLKSILKYALINFRRTNTKQVLHQSCLIPDSVKIRVR